jgi:hypothetical protein
MAMSVRKIETIRPVVAVVDEIVAVLALEKARGHRFADRTEAINVRAASAPGMHIPASSRAISALNIGVKLMRRSRSVNAGSAHRRGGAGAIVMADGGPR